MTKLIPILFFLSFSMGVSTWAHEGHDHGAIAFQPKKGGISKTTQTHHAELIKNKDRVQIYIYNLNETPQTPKQVSLKAQIEFPRKPKAPLTLEEKQDHWEASIPFKGAHRATILLDIGDQNEKNSVQFTVENK